MKKLFCLVLFFSIVLSPHAQDKISIKETQVGVNTIGESKVSVKLILNLKEDYRHRISIFKFNNPDLSFRINSLNEKDIAADAKP